MARNSGPCTTGSRPTSASGGTSSSASRTARNRWNANQNSRNANAQPERGIPMPTATATDNETIHTLDIRKEVFIAASPEIAFAAVLEELGPGSQLPDGKPFPMKIEPWPGG